MTTGLLLEKTRSNPDFEGFVSGMPKLELERGLKTIRSLVQNLLAGFVPPEPSNPYVLVLLRPVRGSLGD